MTPEKTYNPADPAAITLTMEQWQTAATGLTYVIDYHHCKMDEVLANCKDHRMATELYEGHKTAAVQAETVLKIIESAIYPAPPTGTE